MTKKNRTKLGWLYAAAVIVSLSACNTLDSDAKKAANLTNKSIEQMRELKLKKAEKTYLKAQKIINKYKDHKKADEFEKRLRKYRDGKRAVSGKK